ncbi:hypothetical protein AJ80_09621 [Polytolypa hystricis UAMH7299]|uniref:P68 RBP/TagC-like beta-propeller domain-containing protein n=1 Tax=Polytolypa hystricis (strain UAMH7299) TaxID=1447883 RepID=A0A2B7WMS0_POLH7|nr:hypothetical protein AJ80_09621 [Polytolypa hystricis UAMH7299]
MLLLPTLRRLLGLGVLILSVLPESTLAAVPSSKRFDLTKPSYDLYRHKTLRDVTVQQGFAFDNTNRRLFVSQRKDGSATTAGHLCITQLDFSGNYVGHMYLTGFGHGIAFGVQPVGSDTYLWTEVDANSKGYGARLARFKFTSGATLSKDSSAVKKFTPVPAATEHTCSIDPVNNRLVVRHHLNGAKHIAVYDLAAATKDDFSNPLANFEEPRPTVLAERYQGYTAYGQYMYVITGDSYPDAGGIVNSQVYSIDMNTGKVAQGPVLTKAGSTLEFREAEGLAIYRTAAGEVRLFLGFASGLEGDRRSNLFYKNALV